MADINYPGVYVLQPFKNEQILQVFDNIINAFKTVDRDALHQRIEEEFGIASYRQRLDEVMHKRLKLQQHA